MGMVQLSSTLLDKYAVAETVLYKVLLCCRGCAYGVAPKCFPSVQVY